MFGISILGASEYAAKQIEKERQQAKQSQFLKDGRDTRPVRTEQVYAQHDDQTPSKFLRR